MNGEVDTGSCISHNSNIEGKRTLRLKQQPVQGIVELWCALFEQILLNRPLLWQLRKRCENACQ